MIERGTPAMRGDGSGRADPFGERLPVGQEYERQLNKGDELTMMAGPDVYVRCPRCAHVGMYFTFLSGNTFGAKYYTDGRRVAPSLPEVPEVVACLGCEAAFWRDQAEEVAGPWSRMRFPGINDGEERDPAIASAKPLKEPDEAGYFK
ncbi:MAG: hypothetical protein K2W80_01875 [Burkholderiales bacterium]|nr:hypothetical protein [Burkholderiales bacterium]